LISGNFLLENTMRKATAIYHAPPGDSKVVEMCGVTFFDGQSVELNSDDNPHLLLKLPTNKFFEIEIGEDDQKKKVGRPSNADKAAAAAAAPKADAPAKDAAPPVTTEPPAASASPAS
jgi:hypothetical protein